MTGEVKKVLKELNNANAKSSKDNRKKSENTLELAKAECVELFTDQYTKPYAVIRVNSHAETLSLQSQKFRNWIAKLYYDAHGGTLSSEDITSTLNVLKAEAQFNGNQRVLDVRVVGDDSSFYYDLTNPEWQCIKISKNGWKVEAVPVVFTRYANHKPQAYPAKSYPPDIFEKFMQLVNIPDEEDRLLLKCYIISLFIPKIPKPALMLHGQQGSTKTTLQELIKSLVDPSITPTLSFPKDSTELMQKLAHNYIAYFDNVSHIPDWISDDLCKAVTGSGFSKRALYTDDDDVIYSFKRCIGFNGINLAAQKADLLDRGLIIQLERMPKDKRRKLSEIWEEFEGIRPQLLGYIMDLVVQVLKRKGEVVLKETPRMADFAEYGELISRCMGNPATKFLSAYFRNIDLQTEEVLDAHPVGAAIMSAVNDGYPCGHCDSCQQHKPKECSDSRKLTEFSGTSAELSIILDRVAGELNLTNAKGWPKAPNALSRAINDVASNLKEVGISVVRRQTAAKRIIEIGKISSQPSLSSFEHENLSTE